MLKLNKIHSDSRGSINSLLSKLLGAYPEVAVFETKEGYARGGCIHSKSCEHICVISGAISFTFGIDKKTVIMRAGQSLTIPPMTPHYFIAREDCIVAEWGPQMEEKNERYPEFRAIVETINNKVKK